MIEELFAAGQVAAVDQLSQEENNLADVLRRAMTEDDADVAVSLMATLGFFWAITGNNPRVFAMLDGAKKLLERGSQRPSWSRRPRWRCPSWSATWASSRTGTSSR